MVQTKKPVKAEVKKVVSKPKESKAQLFMRLAQKRVEKVLKSLRILGNCSNRGNYEYNENQVESMFQKIQESLNNNEAKFTLSKTEQESFEF